MFWRTLRPVFEIAGIIGICYTIGLASDNIKPLVLFGFFLACFIVVFIDRDVKRGIALLSFCIPFERLGSVDISGVTIRPSQLVALALCIVAGEMILRKKISVPSLPHAPLLLLFFVLSLWSLLNALNIDRSSLVYAFTLFTCVVSLLVPALVRNEDDVRIILKAGCAAYVLVVLFGLYQWAGDWVGLPQSLTGLRTLYTKEILGFPRLQSTALEPLYFANYLLIPLSILTSYFLSKKTFVPLRYLIPMLGAGYLALLLTVARGGYIAFAASIATLGILHIRTLIQPRTIVFGIIAIFFGGVAFSLLSDGTVVTQALNHITDLFGGASYSERVHMYEIALRAFYQHPWLGVGPGGFGPFASIHPYVVPSDGWNIVNNEYLELLAENGVLGLITMIALFVLVIVRSCKALLRSRNEFLSATLMGLTAAFIGILVQYNTFSILYIMHVWFVVGCMIALQNIILSKRS